MAFVIEGLLGVLTITPAYTWVTLLQPTQGFRVENSIICRICRRHFGRMGVACLCFSLVQSSSVLLAIYPYFFRVDLQSQRNLGWNTILVIYLESDRYPQSIPNMCRQLP